VIAQSRYGGAPLNAALNAYFFRAPSNLVCLAVARAPATVVLTYTHSVRYVVVDMGGCPAIVLGTGARRFLSPDAARTVLRYWIATVRPHR
jgi:hypothetical protein